MFNDIRDRSKKRRDRIRKEQADEDLIKFVDQIRVRSDIELTFERSAETGQKPYSYSVREWKLTFHEHPFWAKRASERLMQEKVVIAVSAAKSLTKNVEDFEALFMQLLARRNR